MHASTDVVHACPKHRALCQRCFAPDTRGQRAQLRQELRGGERCVGGLRRRHRRCAPSRIGCGGAGARLPLRTRAHTPEGAADVAAEAAEGVAPPRPRAAAAPRCLRVTAIAYRGARGQVVDMNGTSTKRRRCPVVLGCRWRSEWARCMLAQRRSAWRVAFGPAVRSDVLQLRGVSGDGVSVRALPRRPPSSACATPHVCLSRLCL